MNHNNKFQLKVLFWNTRSFLPRKLEVEKIIHSYDIFICVESWLSPKKKDKILIPGFVTFRKDRIGSKGGGILFLINKRLAFYELQNINSPDDSVEICGIKITNVSPVINIIACYRVPNTNLSQAQWDLLAENVVLEDCSILVGDFNSHSTAWNCKITDNNGTKFERSIDSYNLFLHNANTFTHIDTSRNTKSNLDLVISSMDVADKISFEVCDETWGSDHYPIFITIESEKFFYRKKSFL